MTDLVEFIRTNFPTWRELILYGPPMFLWAFAALTLAGWLKRKYNVRTGYTRKVFHFAIFFTVAAIQVTIGLRPVCLFGAMTTLVIAYTIVRGAGNFHYEAIAREKDAPYRTHYIIVPYLATLLGGLSTSIFFSGVSLIGFLVTGVGDAIGEPLGTRFGKHPYRVPSMRGVVCTRTLEGSCAVFVVSTVAAWIAAYALQGASLPIAHGLGISLLIGALSTLCEAVSPHGWDNFTLQFVPAAVGYALM